MGDKVTSADIRAALKLRYPPNQHALLFEVADGTGGGGHRYADAVAFGLWPSHGNVIEGIEIKVSRADFLAEMKQPEKSQAVFQFCDRWWLACPKGMVKPDELPKTWGMLEFLDNGTLRTSVKAPKLDSTAPDKCFIAAMLRRKAGLDEEASNSLIRREVSNRCREQQAIADKQAEDRASIRVHRAEQAEARYVAIKEATGIDLFAYGCDDDIIKAIALYLRMEKGDGWNSGLAALRKEVARLHGVLSSTMEVANG